MPIPESTSASFPDRPKPKNKNSSIKLSFVLNGKDSSKVTNGSVSYKAFSGHGKHRNQPSSQCLQGEGPIPVGEYLIVDRESGGRLGFLWDMFSNKGDWFALYAMDSKIDDETFCNKVRRGEFRLHPRGTAGVSYGCVVIESAEDYKVLRSVLAKSKMETDEASKISYYGKLTVSADPALLIKKEGK